jgi:GTP-binding protein HflX
MPARSELKPTLLSPHVVLVLPREGADPRNEAELTSLLHGLGLEIAAKVAQKRTPLDSPHPLGKGKLSELRALLAELRSSADRELIVVVAADLTPSEQRTLVRELDVEVLDRSAIILRVFEERARTRIAKLEIELARKLYELPRVRDDHSLGDREGGGGRGERGHSNVELQKQRIRKAIAALRKQVEAEQGVHRRQRERRAAVPHAALVGYTNAGKSSWMRALTRGDVLIEDRLFATLATTVREMAGKGPKLLVSDTVGFLRHLPHHLVQSFRSTLETSLDAGLLVIVADGSDAEVASQIEVTRSVLDDLGCRDKPTLLLLNKVDRASEEQRSALAAEFPEALLVNAHEPQDVERVRRALYARSGLLPEVEPS